MDKDGDILHRWQKKEDDVLQKDPKRPSADILYEDNYEHMEL